MANQRTDTGMLKRFKEWGSRPVRKKDAGHEDEPTPWLQRRVTLLAVAVLALVAGIGGYFSWQAFQGPEPEKVPLSESLSDIQAGLVESARIDDQANTVTLTLTETDVPEMSVFPNAYAGDLTTVLLDNDVKTETDARQSRNPLIALALSYGPVILIIAFILYLVSSGKLTGGIGKLSGGRGDELEDVPSTRFSDVAGCDEAVEDLRELAEFLNDDEKFRKLGARVPAGALLVGPPGTGKTLLARALAGETGASFFPMSGSDFNEVFVGVGGRRIRNLFDNAKSCGKAVIFIDEIDAVGRSRSGGSPVRGPAESEHDNTLLALLNELDGFHENNVVVIAATNREEVLDEALTRPGRIERRIEVPNPDRGGREHILRVHCAGKPVEGDVDFATLARQTSGMSGAALASLVNEACIRAARIDKETVGNGEFHDALATLALGRARASAVVTEQDRLVTAWHEAGHTVAALVQPDSDNPVSVSIVPRGPAGGATWTSGSDNMFLWKEQTFAHLVRALAGRAGEALRFGGKYTQGAESDLSVATELATKMVTRYGMTGFGKAQITEDTLRAGGPVARSARRHINKLLDQASETATVLLQQHRTLLQAVADALLEHETLDAEQIRNLHVGHSERTEVPTSAAGIDGEISAPA